MASPNTIAKKLHETSRSKRFRDALKPVRTGAWSVVWTPARQTYTAETGATVPGNPLNVLSIKLLPGRSTTEADWRFFGALLAAMGVPRDVANAEIEDDTKDTPKGSYYFMWPPETRH